MTCDLVLILLIISGFFLVPYFLKDRDSGALNPLEKPEIEHPVELSISCVGDVMAHKTQIDAQYNKETGTYEFDNNFQHIKSYIEEADLALCNVETTFRGAPYSGYPNFNAPDALAAALKNAGFDVALTANNHMADTGFSGMQRTLTVLRETGLLTAGTRLEGEKPYAVTEVKGVKIAVLPYTYETTAGAGGATTINGNGIDSKLDSLSNHFSYQTLDADLATLGAQIKDARENGAELVICYFHWGQEYQREPDQWQKDIAKKTAALGADIIFASHPHVLQGMEMLTDDATGKQVPVFYSMGNFISNQRAETMDNNRYTEQGMIANVRLVYMKSTGQILSIAQDVMPTWVDRYKVNGKTTYALVPLDANLASSPVLAASGHLQRAKQALADVKALLGEEAVQE